jgi:hypothetical protein
MGSRVLKLAICVISFLLLSPTAPVNATEAPIIDYCGKKTSGKVRAIAEGRCGKSERSLGNQALVRTETRPTKLVTQLNSRFLVARAAAQKKGYDLNITSGYRSLDRQKYLFKQAVKKHGSKAKASKWVLPAEKSNHPWGLAIDINYRINGPKARQSAAWLEKHGYKYGLCRRYVNEWWHFEPLVPPGTLCPAMEPYAS